MLVSAPEIGANLRDLAQPRGRRIGPYYRYTLSDSGVLLQNPVWSADAPNEGLFDPAKARISELQHEECTNCSAMGTRELLVVVGGLAAATIWFVLSSGRLGAAATHQVSNAGKDQCQSIESISVCADGEC